MAHTNSSISPEAKITPGACRNPDFPGYRAIEWPTIALIVACFGLWIGLTFYSGFLPAIVTVPALTVVLGLHTSIQHEVLHGHPFRSTIANDALMLGGINIWVPFLRFKDTHLKHHEDENLTDPFDDPESFYRCPLAWKSMSRPMQRILQIHNTFVGRMLLGPGITICRLVIGDIGTIIRGPDADRRRVALCWGLHLPGAAIVMALVVNYATVHWFSYLIAVYFSISIILIRSFLEHQADEDIPRRTVIVDHAPIMGFLFLNNNLHVAHHTRPSLAWYRLPGFYRQHREKFLAANGGYRFDNYWQIAKRFAFTGKEPVPHPVMQRKLTNGRVRGVS